MIFLPKHDMKKNQNNTFLGVGDGQGAFFEPQNRQKQDSGLSCFVRGRWGRTTCNNLCDAGKARKPIRQVEVVQLGTVQVWLLNGVEESNLFKATAEMAILGITY